MLQSKVDFGRLDIPADEPFRRKLPARWRPKAMISPPALSSEPPVGPCEPRFALLVNPFYPKDPHASFGKHVLTPTLALTSVAAATPSHWRVACWDENLLQGPPPSEPAPQVVGITVHLTFARRAYELAAWFRTRGAAVVLGGLHALSCPDEVAPHTDAVAIGDGVQLWPKILADFEAGRLKKIYRADYTTEYRLDPPARRDLVPRRSFLTTASLIATRGCHNRCGFCYLATDGLRMPYRMRDPEQVASEFRDTNEPYAVFIDNNLGSKPEYLRQLCRALRPLEKIWSAAVTLDVSDDPSLIREMALAGCTGVFIGFESLSDSNLSAAQKRTPRTDDYARRVGIFHANGIQVNGSFVLGFDDDRKECFSRFAQWIEENRLECATFHILTPYPGTPLFHDMERQGRLLHKNWSFYDTAHVVFQPRHMTPDELQQGYQWLYHRLFSHASIWRRRPHDPRAILPYLAMSYLYKKSNFLWHTLIRSNLTHAVWRPIVEWTRRRHIKFRARLAVSNLAGAVPVRVQSIVTAGV
ncbi:MAG TPA: radical SAM protein [Verrucomicrobiae bacterium]